MKTPSTRSIQYRCRRCGETFDKLCVDPLAAVTAIRFAGIEEPGYTEPMGPPSIKLQPRIKHQCDDWGIGIADLVGCGPEVEDEV